MQSGIIAAFWTIQHHRICAAGMELPFPRHFSAGDQRQDLLGERNDDTASNSQDAVCALGRIVRFERQNDLQNAKAKQDQADGTNERENKVTQIVDNRQRIAVRRESRDNKNRQHEKHASADRVEPFGFGFKWFLQ